MIAHIVLLQPRKDLGPSERGLALQTLSQAAATVPGLARLRIGRRVLHGLPGYEQQMTADCEFVLVMEFESLEALKAYLAAPTHEVLGRLLSTGTSSALAYDYDLRDPGDVAAVAEEWITAHKPAH